MTESPAPPAAARARAPGVGLAALASALGAVFAACEFGPGLLEDRAGVLLLAREPLAAATPLGWLGAHAAALLPFGPLPFRVTLAVALCAAVALAALYRVFWHAASRRVRPLLAAPFALGLAALVLTLAGALAAHPRVHAPAWMFACLALDAALGSERTRRHTLRAWLWSAALGLELLALSAANVRLLGAGEHGDCSAADLLADLDRRTLPPRSLALLGATSRLSLETGELEEHARPDLTVVPKPWQLDLDGATALARRHPELRPLLRSAVLLRELPLAELRALAATRSLLLDMEPNEAELYESVVPVGLLHQIQTSSVTRSELRAALRESEPLQAAVLGRLAAVQVEPETRAWLAARLRIHVEHLASRNEAVARKKVWVLSRPWLTP